MATRQQLEQALQNPNMRKMLDVIAKSEGVKHGYNTLFGNQYIDNLGAHPNVRKEFKQTDGKTNYTTAAGRYQFLNGTWNNVAKQYGLNDFTQQNQDLGAVALIAGRGALQDVLSGNYQQAIGKLGGEWASLPSSTYKQGKRSWEQINQWLGQPSEPQQAQQQPQRQRWSDVVAQHEASQAPQQPKRQLWSDIVKQHEMTQPQQNQRMMWSDVVAQHEASQAPQQPKRQLWSDIVKQHEAQNGGG